MSHEASLSALGITLPVVPPPASTFVNAVGYASLPWNICLEVELIAEVGD